MPVVVAMTVPVSIAHICRLAAARLYMLNHSEVH